MGTAEVWLQLTEAFGGEAFGPLEGPEVRLGTAEDVDIQLGQGLGVEPNHARLVRKSPDTFYLSAVDRNGEVWLWRAGSTRPAPLHGPVVVRPGDGFSLGGPQGVRFTLTLRQARAATLAKGAGTASAQAGQLGAGLASEIGRRVHTSALGTWWGSFVDASVRFVKQRQFLAPVYLVGLFTMATGWGYGTVKCRDADRWQGQATVATQRAEVCTTELEQARTTRPSVSDLGALAGRITQDPTLPDGLGWSALLDATRGRLPRLLDADRTAIRIGWIDGDRSPWGRVATALTEGGLPPAVAAALAWATVEPDVAAPDPGPRWGVSTDGACLRGPLRLTYSQAVQLGLAAQPDTFLPYSGSGDLGGEDTHARLVGALRGTETAATRAAPTVADDAPIGPGEPVRGGQCYAVTGPDDRDDLRAVAAALATHLGPKAAKLPEPALGGAVLARAVKLQALRLPPDDLDHLDLSDGHKLDAGFPSPEAARTVAEAEAEPLAASLALPCLLLLARGEDAFPKALPRPDFDACAILSARAAAGRW